jgi:hypothetical protein
MSSKPIKVDSDHHQRADGHVVAVGNTAATQASQGTVAAVVTTAIMVWSLVLVVLEVRANRRGGSVPRAQDNPARRRVQEPDAAGETAAPPVRRTRAAEEAGGESGLIEFGTLGPHRGGLPALSFGRDGDEAEGSFGRSAAAT